MLEAANQFASLIPVNVVILAGTVVEASIGNYIEQTDCRALGWMEFDCQYC